MRRLRRALRRRDFEHRLDDEMRFHVEQEEAELVRRGCTPTEAHRRAMAAFGGFDRWRDEARETRLGSRLEILARDARLGLRALRRSPSYAVPAALTLALGIAAVASIATLAYDILLRPLPYDDPSRLVAVYERNIPRKRDRNVVSAVALLAWRERSRTMDSVSGMVPASAVWTTDAGPERLSGAEVTPALFALLGRRPLLGPGFSASVDRPEVMVSHDFFTRRLEGDASLVGRAIPLDGVPTTLVGVMPAGFTPLRLGWMGEQEFWKPLRIGQQQRSWGRFLLVVGRLRPGATVDAADREVRALHAQLRAEGSIAEGWDAQVLPLTEELIGSVRAPVSALLVACGLLLVIVLTNATLLTVAHLRRHAGDRALRAVLGATNGRLIAERLTSTALLALGGTLLGLGTAAAAIAALTRSLPRDLPRLDGVHAGGATLLVGAATGLVASLTLALVPMLDRRDSGVAELHGGARLTRNGGTTWVVIAEAATAVVLTLFAALTLRSFERLSAVDVGFDPAPLMAFRVAFERPGLTPAGAQALSQAFLEHVRSIPGVVAVGRTSVRPFHRGGTATTVTPAGFGDRDRSAYPTADVRFVDPGYFRTLGLTPLSGRLFTSSSPTAGDSVMRVVVNEAFARALFPEASTVVGRAFDLRIGENPAAQVVGVVRDVRLVSPRAAARPTVYVSTTQVSAGEEYDVIVRAANADGASTVMPAVRAAAQAVAPGTPLFRVERMRSTVGATIANERATALLLAFFAGSALLLVAVGVYGLYDGEVTRRRREIGVRMALGATSASVVGALVQRAGLRAAIGAGVGAVAGFGAARVLESVLYDIRVTDPASYVGAVALVLLVALGATLVPARQAAGVAPSVVLRGE